MARQLALGDRLGPQLANLGRRFPWAVLAAVLFALYFLLDLHRPHNADPATLHLRLFRIPAGLTAAFLWALLVALASEVRGSAGTARHIITIAGFAILAVLVHLADRLDVVMGLVVSAALLGVGIAPYVLRPSSQGAYWQFNHELWVGFLAAAVAALLFGAGLSAIIETLRYLFGFHISSAIHEKVWAVSTGLVGPLYWASVVPEDFTAEAQEGPASEFVSRMVALLVKFILVPMLLVYAIILHIYAAKIGLDMSLPKGRVGWLTVSFGGMVVLAALLAYPTRASGGPLVALFWRIWPLLLIIPTGVLFIGVWRRIADYGVTEARYWLVLAGVWLAVLAVSQGLLRRDLRWLPASAAILMLAACLGPWGLYGLSSRSQAAEFSAALGRAGLLQDGRIRPGSVAGTSIPANEARRLSSILYYFTGRHRLDLLRPIFAGDADDPFEPRADAKPNSPRESTWQIAERIRARLGIGRASTSSPDAVAYNVQFPWTAALPDGRHLVPGTSVYRARGAAAAKREITGLPYTLTVSLDGSRIVFEGEAPDATTIFDLGPLDQDGGPLRTFKLGEARQAIVLTPTSGPLPLTVIATNINGTRQNGSLEIGSVTFHLIAGRKP